MSALIAIIDDDRETRELLRDALLLEGYQVVLISFSEPLPELLSQTPDLILLDVMIQNKDGYILCQEIKQHTSLSKIPILFVTGMHDIEQKSIAAGASGHLIKPFLLQELYQKIEGLLSK
jgi:two-component system OmpR family response regulator